MLFKKLFDPLASCKAALARGHFACKMASRKIARATATQITKFDAVTRAAAKKFIKPIPHEELRREIDLFCELFTRPEVMAALKKFVESTEAMPYLP